uniref:Small ribosomal subunit protein bS16c n=1 Tax=Ishige okamurae TaxID=233772 RepID=A0A8E5XRF9_9PHAE|nr:ribosomal protein S16 [Ishige okamurae]QVJ99650.1 ribosomal protein S16 [Ishige okamurae]WAM64086.1 30S ribosomal protein S16 [Ishige okamurae]
MLKIRLKRFGRKKKPFYRIVLMDASTKRDGKAIEELGFYNPLNKIFYINRERIIMRIKTGAQPTQIVSNLLKKSKFFET